jgi:fructose-1,6-bisphosphatase/inositol monophosphatase family enzyme
VRRASDAILKERTIFEATNKRGYGGSMNDVFTSADTAAQKIYVRAFEECFPGYGIIGEENALSVAPTAEDGLYFTVDPLDGTKAFVRRQSYGFGTMVALVRHSEVISAYVGNPMTREVFGFRPHSKRAHRITDLNDSEELPQNPKKEKLKKQYALLRDPIEKYRSPLCERTLKKSFKQYELGGGSIGIWAARLWTQEVAALFLTGGGHETPWDSTPIIGISQKLGYVFLRPNADETAWVPYTPKLVTVTEKRTHPTLIVHRDVVSELVH